MSYQDGLTLFKSGDYYAAIEQFKDSIKEDKNNHKAWNALGICFFRLGKYDKADTCFKHAIHLQPDNETYKKNKTANNLKREKEKDILSVDDRSENIEEPNHRNNQLKTTKQKDHNSNNSEIYQRNWLQIPVFFGSIIGIWFVQNWFFPYIGISIWLGCAEFIKRDAEKINAGNNQDASFFGKLKGWEWFTMKICNRSHILAAGPCQRYPSSPSSFMISPASSRIRYAS